MASFAEFLAWPDREEIIRVVMTPSLTLTGWTLETGSTYKVTFSRFESFSRLDTPNTDTDHLDRRVTGVRQNDVDLTERTSIATVDANPGSWWWDDTNSLLYVRTTTGASPNAFTAMQGFISLYFASKGLVLNRVDGDVTTGIYHEPWVTDHLPQVIFFVDDPIEGTKQVPNAELALVNAHGWFNDAYRNYNWRNKKVQIALGGSYNGQDLLLSQYQPTMTMLIENLAPGEDLCRFQLKPLLRLLEQQIPVTPYFAANYPRLGEGVSGTKKWIGYGRALLPADLTDTNGAGTYTIADAAFQTLFAIHAVYAIPKNSEVGGPQGLTNGVHYTQDLTACTITVTTLDYAWQNFTLVVDVTGKPDGVGGYLKTFSAITQDLLTTFLKVPTTDLDASAFTTAAAAAPQELALWIKSPRSLASVFSNPDPEFPGLERSVLGRVLQTTAGKWTCQIFAPGGTAVASLHKEDFKSFVTVPSLDTVAPTVLVRFNENHAAGSWEIASKTDSAVQYKTESADQVSVTTFLRHAADAEVLARRMARVIATLSLGFDFEERGTLLATASPGQKVAVSYSPAPSVGQALSNVLLEIQSLTRGLMPALTVSGRLVLHPLDPDPYNALAKIGKWQSGAGAGHWGGGSLTQWY